MEKRLVKSNRNRVIAGVCGGIGEYLNIDPTVIRLIFLIFLFFCGTGIFLYLIASILIPSDNQIF